MSDKTYWKVPVTATFDTTAVEEVTDVGIEHIIVDAENEHYACAAARTWIDTAADDGKVDADNIETFEPESDTEVIEGQGTVLKT